MSEAILQYVITFFFDDYTWRSWNLYTRMKNQHSFDSIVVNLIDIDIHVINCKNHIFQDGGVSFRLTWEWLTLRCCTGKSHECHRFDQKRTQKLISIWKRSVRFRRKHYGRHFERSRIWKCRLHTKLNTSTWKKKVKVKDRNLLLYNSIRFIFLYFEFLCVI